MTAKARKLIDHVFPVYFFYRNDCDVIIEKYLNGCNHLQALFL